jgi:16S rRNA (cytidine1402-2'-O)-methyltransferase
MPGISDPGYELVVAAIEHGIPVVPIPGASAVTTALASSGLATDVFTFLGFLPAKSVGRRRLLESEKKEKGTLLFLEAPHRLQESLEDILAVLGDRKIAVCRELTKLHEEIYRGTVSQAITHFTAPKGEFTLVIEGNRNEESPQMTGDIGEKLHSLRLAGVPAKDAVAAVAAETGLSKRELYRVWLEKNRD